jgi:DNA-binding HxlR family transcriptional regulator
MVTLRKPTEEIAAAADGYPALTLEIMDLVGNKWTLLLVYLLADRPLRFSELKRGASPISQKMLTQKLRELERYGMVDRFVWPTTPPKVEYALTALGRSFLDAASVICEWTRDNVADLDDARAAFDAAHS